MKACTVNGCDKPHRARGFCITHYNEMHAGPERHRTTKRCECCGVSYITTRTNGRFCSYLCRDYTRWGPRAVPVRRPKQRQPKPKPPVLGPRDCAWCGSTFQPRSVRNVFCSRRCGNKTKLVKRRGRIAGAGGTYTWVEVTRLHLLFGRRCAYCEQPVNGQPDPDHVVPLSRGGHNSITNILPACHTCNGDKRDLLLSEWNIDRARRGLAPVRTEWPAWDIRTRHLTTLNTPREVGGRAA